MNTVYDYPTDVTDDQWELLHPLLPELTWRPGGPGRPPCDVRRMLNGILSLNRTGCQWRLVPKAFGHWSPIYGYFKR
jgi:putative transposase